MDTKNLSLSSALVALPVAHLLVASLYTWGWLSGFGANVSVLADPRDLFSVSISKLVPVYLIGLVMPVAQLVFMNRRVASRTASSTASERSIRWTGIAIIISLWGLLLFSTLVSYDLRNVGRAQGIHMLIAMNIAGVLAYKFFLDHIDIPLPAARVVNIGIGLLCASIGFGLADGNFARYAKYDAYQDRLARCGDTLVQRRFGDHYLGVKTSNEKVVIDLTCETVMTIPAVSREARREFHWRPYPHLHYVFIGSPSPKH